LFPFVPDAVRARSANGTMAFERERVPKLKSHSGAKKRFEVTGRGKLRRAKAYKGHLNQHKSPGRKRRHQGKALVAKGDLALVRKLLPNH
jgi:large subunit ribosomal protein L35